MNITAQIDLLHDFLGPLARAMLQAGGELLVLAAKEAVIATVADPALLTSESKRLAAVAIIVIRLQQKGIPIVMRAVNGAVEAAYAAYREQMRPPKTWDDVLAEARKETE